MTERKRRTHATKQTPSTDAETATSPSDAIPPKRRPGKSSNPDYVSTSIIILSELRDEIQIQLRHYRRRTGERLDVSDLINRLLTQWLEEEQRQENQRQEPQE